MKSTLARVCVRRLVPRPTRVISRSPSFTVVFISSPSYGDGATHQPGDAWSQGPGAGKSLLRSHGVERRLAARRRSVLLPGRRHGVRPMDGAGGPLSHGGRAGL